MSLASSVKNSRFVPVLVPIAHNRWALPVALAVHSLLIATLIFSASNKIQQPVPRVIVQAELWQALPDTNKVVNTTNNTDSPKMNHVVLAPVPVTAVVTPSVVPKAMIATQRIKQPIIKPKAISKPPTPLPSLKVEKSIPEPKIKSKISSQVPPTSPSKHAAILPSPVLNSPDSEKENQSIQAAKSAKDAARSKELSRLNSLLNNATPVLSTPQGLGVGWGAKLKACVQPHLRYNDTSGANPRVEFVVKLNAMGSPKSIEISKSSNNDAYDAAVERALRRCDPFPLPDSGSYPIAGVTVGYRLND